SLMRNLNSRQMASQALDAGVQSRQLSTEEGAMNRELKFRGFVGTPVLCAVAVVSLNIPTARSQSVSRAGSPAPAAVENQVEAMLRRMSLEEKINLIGGVDGFFIRAMPSAGLPALKMADGPMGVRNF